LKDGIGISHTGLLLLQINLKKRSEKKGADFGALRF
jgi:hypothetical protein